MFERFDDSAKRVIVLAQEEARKLDHPFIGTEHLLLALLRQDSAAARALTGLGIGYDAVLARVEQALGRGATPTPSHIPFTPATKRAVERGFEASVALKHRHIGPEHLLLGLVRDENEATGMLADLGADAQRIRDSLRPDDPGQNSSR
jgi:ATP-dependent Clp protease ATP-binding subunit ClpC